MQHYVGLDVSVKETSVCIVDKAGKVIREVTVATEPVAIFAVLTEEPLAIERIGLEAGPLSQWLYSALAEAGLPVICVETRHMKAALSAQVNKSDAELIDVGRSQRLHDQSALVLIDFDVVAHLRARRSRSAYVLD
jgi:transposase